MLAEIEGREYQPGGAAEIDELVDIDRIYDPPRAEEKDAAKNAKEFETWD